MPLIWQEGLCFMIIIAYNAITSRYIGEIIIAGNWESLITQVEIWQGVSGLEWTKNDIREVSRYLNAELYHYP